MAMASTVVKTEPISTMNITGLRHNVARVELAQRVRQRPEQLLGVQQAAADPPRAARRRCRGRRVGRDDSHGFGASSQTLGQRAEGERGQVGQRDQDDGDADEHADEQRL